MSLRHQFLWWRKLLNIHKSNKKSISVTYDLLIVKVAMQLQAEEAPKYDDIFVNMGAFHVDMAFFSALGKYLAESGGPHNFK